MDLMRARLMGAAVLVVILAVLGILVSQGAVVLLDLDRSVGSALHFRQGSSGVDVLQVLTAPGLTVFRLVVLVPIAVLFAVRRRWRVTGFILAPALLVSPLTTLLKDLVGRVRPTDDPLVSASGLSFPSGHSSGAATLAGVLLVVLWPVVSRGYRPLLALGLTLLALMVAWTRMALGVHYLSDTVGGLCLGAAVVLLSMTAFGLYPDGPGDLTAPAAPESLAGPVPRD